MKNLIVLLSLVFMSFTAVAETKKFGGEVAKTPATSLAAITSNFGQYEGKTVVVEAVPQKVCEKKGCWMTISDGKQEIRTVFKNYGFFVPKEVVGKKVKMQGVMEKKMISAAKLRHFMKDGGAPQSEIDKVKEGQVQYQFTADALEMI